MMMCCTREFLLKSSPDSLSFSRNCVVPFKDVDSDGFAGGFAPTRSSMVSLVGSPVTSLLVLSLAETLVISSLSRRGFC